MKTLFAFAILLLVLSQMGCETKKPTEANDVIDTLPPPLPPAMIKQDECCKCSSWKRIAY